jgi:molybdate transport system ATP-binding protein
LLDVRLKKTLPGFTLNVAFSIDKIILSILGPSGCGKTMTLKTIAGLLQPDQGFIKLNGNVLLDTSAGRCLPPQQRRVGFVFQNYALFPHLNVFQNIAFGIRHLHKEEVYERVNRLLGQMRLSGLEQRCPGQLSGGQQQRVAVARALITNPEVLLLDEPFSALDTQVKEKMERELQDLHNFYHGDVLFVTHNLAEAYRLSSQIAVYESGQIMQFGPKEEIIKAPASRQVARFTGVRNLIDGVVRDDRGQDLVVRIGDWGATLRVSSRSGECYRTGQPVTVGIRSEYVQLSDNPGQNAFCGVIRDIEEGVTNCIYRLILTGVTSTKDVWEADISRNTGRLLSIGQKCYLCLPPERLFLMKCA